LSLAGCLCTSPATAPAAVVAACDGAAAAPAGVVGYVIVFLLPLRQVLGVSCTARCIFAGLATYDTCGNRL
jgi:hypothetical protein